MFRSIRPAVLLALVVAVACTDQPTEPTEVPSLQGVVAPPPAPPTPLTGTLGGGTGLGVSTELGFWESAVYATVTVDGALGYSGRTDGYLPGTGQIDAAGILVQSQCYLTVYLSFSTGPSGGTSPIAPTCWYPARNQGSYSRRMTLQGRIWTYRTAGPPLSCYKGVTPCVSYTGTQTITVTPEEGKLILTPNRDWAVPGGGIYVFAKGVWASNPATTVPMTVREWRWEGVGPEVGGGHTKVCAQYLPNECVVQVAQSGYVVLEAVVNGQVKTEKLWIRVVGGDSLPPPPPPPDSLPDEPPGDTGGNGGGGGGGGGCSSSFQGAPPLNSQPMGVCDPPPPPPPVKLNVTLGPDPETPNGPGGKPWILPARTVGPDGGEYEDFGLPPRSFGRSWPDSAVYRIHLDSVGTAISRTVSVFLESFDSAGTTIDAPFGHYHVGRATSGGALPKPVGSVSASSVSTDAHGDASFIYRPSEISGPILLKIITENADTVRDTLWVGVPNLVNLLGETKFDLKELDESNYDHPDRFWVTEGMRELLRDFGDSIMVNYAQRPVITDAGLRFGGKYDLDTQWDSADPECILKQKDKPAKPFPVGCHYRHRLGHDADLRTFDSSDERLDYTDELWLSFTGINAFREGDHFHLRYQE